MNEELLNRIDNLIANLQETLPRSCSIVLAKNGEVKVETGSTPICSVLVCDECYYIKTSKLEWKETTTYVGDIKDGLFCYYVDTLDECAGEINRLYSSFSNMLSSHAISIDWSQSTEQVLFRICNILSKVVEGSNYRIERNTTKGEKNLDVYYKGQNQRVLQIWPKVNKQVIDTGIRTTVFKIIKSSIELPQDTDMKSGRLLSWRVVRVDMNKLIEIMDYVKTIPYNGD